MSDNITERTSKELELGLKYWVALYIDARKSNLLEPAKTLRSYIDNRIINMELDRNQVFFFFGNPDNPEQKAEVYARVKETLACKPSIQGN